MGKKRKKHQWQIDLEKEQERLKNRPPLPREFAQRQRRRRTAQERILDMLGIPASIIVLGNPNYSSARLDLARHIEHINRNY